MSYSNVKSVVLDIADNWDATEWGMAVRSIEFLNTDSDVISLTASDFTAYATTYNYLDDASHPRNAFDTTLSKTGIDLNNEWYSDCDNYSGANQITDQRLICVFNNTQSINGIVVNNHHLYGDALGSGIKNVKIYFSTDTIADTTYNASISNSTLVFDGQIDQHIASDEADDQVLTLINNSNNGYVPPIGNNIQFVFTGSYIPPVGDNIIFDFALTGNTVDFNFIDDGYVPPSSNEIVFWFLPSREISLSNSIVNTLSSIDFVSGFTLQSITYTTSSLEVKSDIVISLETASVITESLLTPNSDSWVLIELPSSDIAVDSFIYFGQDKYGNLPISICNTSTNIEFLYDITISFPTSTLNIINNISYLIKYAVDNTLTTISSITFKDILKSEFQYLINIGRIVSTIQYVNTLQEKFHTDITYINGLSLISDISYNNSFEMISNNVIVNNLFKTTYKTFNYNNTLLDVVNSNHEYNVSMFIVSNNIIINDIKQNLISDIEYSNQLSLFSSDNILITENEYLNNLFNNITNNNIYSNLLTYNICQDLEYKNANYIYNDNIILNNLFNIIHKVFDYHNTLLNILNNNHEYNVSMFIVSNNIVVNNIKLNLISDIEYSNQLSLFSNNNILITGNEYVNNLFNNIINNNTHNNLLSITVTSEMQYKNGIQIYSDNVYQTTVGIELINENININDLTAYITSGLNISNYLLETNIIYSNNKIAYYLGSDSSIRIENSTEAYIDNQLINLISCEISIDSDSFSYNFSADVSTIQDWFLCVPNKEIIVYLNTNEYKFIINSRSRTREFNSDNYTIQATSKTSILDTNVVTKTYESVFVSDIIEELCNSNNINYEYDMIDWSLPSGLLTADKETPISIMQRLTDACGGIIICDNLGNLKFKSKYPISPLLYNSYVDTFNDYDNIFNVSESTEIQDKWNAVIISNIAESTDYSYSISEIDDLEDIYTKHLRVKVFPYLQRIDLLTSFISSGILIRDYDNPITETINEIVEIVEGKGNTSDSIKQIVSYEYLNTNLGTLLFNNNEITTQIYGQSLIKITYKTEYHDFILYNGLKTSDIQVYTNDEYEVI